MVDARSGYSVFPVPGAGGPRTRILLFRHGESEGASEGRFYGREDVDLLPRGADQMREAARRAAPWLDESGVLLFTSPRRRARYSAEALRASLGPAASGVVPEVVDGLAELDLGRWEGETQASLSAREPERLRAHYADFVRSRSPGGESLAELTSRVRPAFAALKALVAGCTAAVVAHLGVNRVILCDALGAPLESFFRIEQDHACLNLIDFYGETPIVRLLNG